MGFIGKTLEQESDHNEKAPNPDEVATDSDGAHLELPVISRRKFVGFLSSALIATHRPWFGLFSFGSNSANSQCGPVTISAVFDIVRASDLLCVQLGLINLEKDFSSTPPRLIRVDPNCNAYLVWAFQPQHLAESIFELDQTPGGLVQLRSAQPSRLVFKVPDGMALNSSSGLQYTLESLLKACKSFDLNVVAQALPRMPASTSLPLLNQSTKPNPEFTAIEAPYRVVLSPTATSRWEHAALPVTDFLAGTKKRKDLPSCATSPTANDEVVWTELWHTRLSGGDDDEIGAAEDLPTLRAIWSPDFPSPAAEQIHSSLTPDIRRQIVDLSSGFSDPQRQAERLPRVINARRLMLSPLGAWAELNYSGEPPQNENLNLEEWVHILSAGRDQFVRVREKGFLFPFGHRATRIDVIERVVLGGRAFLRKTTRVAIVQERIAYSDLPQQGRELPFKQLSIITKHSAPLKVDDAAPDSKFFFWPQTFDEDFQFQFRGLDHNDQVINFQAPALFVFSTTVENAPDLQRAQAEYTKSKRANVPMSRQAIAFAPSLRTNDASTGSATPTSMPTIALQFAGNLSDAGVALRRPFFPSMSGAAVRIRALDELVGAGAANSYNISLNPTYLAGGFSTSTNPGEVFADLTKEAKIDFNDWAAKSGNLVAPNMSIAGLSRQIGPVGGQPGNLKDSLDSVRLGQFDPEKFFRDATLFGLVPLTSIVDQVQDFTSSAAKMDQVPRMLSNPIYAADGKTLTSFETRFNWKPQIKATTSGHPLLETSGNTKLTFTVVARTSPKDPSTVSHETTMMLENFSINLLPDGARFIQLTFEKLTYLDQSERGNRFLIENVSAALDDRLKLVQKLQKFLGTRGKGLNLKINSWGLSVGFSFSIPQVSIGVFSLQNVSLASAFNLPLNGGKLNVRFAFGEPHNPFHVTVGIFGGGGFFVLELGVDGPRVIDLGIEFGGSFGIDLGVASGRVSVMGGIRFTLVKAGVPAADALCHCDVCCSSNSTTQTAIAVSAYVRASGSLRVLGIVNISVTFYLGLTYCAGDNKLFGGAELEVTVEVLFFSASVTLCFAQEFAGGSDQGANPHSHFVASAQPTAGLLSMAQPGFEFRDFMPKTVWENEYCPAFA